MTLSRLASLTLAVGVGVSALAGCSDDSPRPAVTATSPSAPVIQPGKPGESATTLTGSAAAPTVAPPTAEPADARFYTEMIEHHAQAIVMVDSVAGSLDDPEVKALAERIGAEQKPEVEAMARWLEERGRPVPPAAKNPRLAAAGHQGHSMPGMATEAELADLAKARGVAADRLFLRLMIRHHEGALTMIDDFIDEGGPTDPTVDRTMSEINVTQARQIEFMEQMARRLA